MHYPDYLLVGVAVVISHVVTSLGRQVAKARELGSYQLGELLERGGMGEVYRATHRMLARPAAIKLIRPDDRLGRSSYRAARDRALPARGRSGCQPALSAGAALTSERRMTRRSTS
jgi:serine/threonine-protein kinase